jgi:hypothetical protein
MDWLALRSNCLHQCLTNVLALLVPGDDDGAVDVDDRALRLLRRRGTGHREVAYHRAGRVWGYAHAFQLIRLQQLLVLGERVLC